MRNFFKNYQELIKSDDFIKFKKDLSSLLDKELCKDDKEVQTVKEWIEKINGKSCGNKGLDTTINSLFIHGYTSPDKGSFPSGVEFEYYCNKKNKKELADIIFITSFFYKSKKVLEKITFNQAKWTSIGKTSTSWAIDEGQLYLLSRLPRFKGVNGSFISNKDYYIDDISKSLTSYGLMNKENFVFISTNHLMTAMGGKKSINLKDFQNLEQSMSLDIEILDEYLDEYFDFIRRYGRYTNCCLGVFNKLLGSSPTHFSNNTFEFLSEYLKGNIGEIIYNDITNIKNSGAKTLMSDIMENVYAFGGERGKEFINGYENNGNIEYINNLESIEHGNNLGIIQTKINLGE